MSNADKNNDSVEDDTQPSVEEVFEEGYTAAFRLPYDLLNAIKEAGGQPTDLNFLVNNQPLLRGIAEAVIRERIKDHKKSEFIFPVDYRLSLNQLIVTAAFEVVAPLIAKAGFEVATGKKKMIIGRLWAPEQSASFEEVREHVTRLGFRLADAKALVAFVAKNSTFQLEHPIFALGSVGKDPEDDSPVVLCATTDSEKKKRELIAETINGHLEPVDYILIIRDAPDGSSSDPQPA